MASSFNQEQQDQLFTVLVHMPMSSFVDVVTALKVPLGVLNATQYTMAADLMLWAQMNKRVEDLYEAAFHEAPGLFRKRSQPEIQVPPHEDPVSSATTSKGFRADIRIASPGGKYGASVTIDLEEGDGSPLLVPARIDTLLRAFRGVEDPIAELKRLWEIEAAARRVNAESTNSDLKRS